MTLGGVKCRRLDPRTRVIRLAQSQHGHGVACGLTSEVFEPQGDGFTQRFAPEPGLQRRNECRIVNRQCAHEPLTTLEQIPGQSRDGATAFAERGANLAELASQSLRAQQSHFDAPSVDEQDVGHRRGFQTAVEDRAFEEYRIGRALSELRLQRGARFFPEVDKDRIGHKHGRNLKRRAARNSRRQWRSERFCAAASSRMRAAGGREWLASHPLRSGPGA